MLGNRHSVKELGLIRCRIIPGYCALWTPGFSSSLRRRSHKFGVSKSFAKNGAGYPYEPLAIIGLTVIVPERLFPLCQYEVRQVTGRRNGRLTTIPLQQEPTPDASMQLCPVHSEGLFPPRDSPSIGGRTGSRPGAV